jgi:hypothetical protein
MNIVESVLQDMRECEKLGQTCPQEAYAWVNANHAKVEEYYNNGMSVEDISDYVRLTNPATETPVLINPEVLDPVDESDSEAEKIPDKLLEETMREVCSQMPDAARFFEDGYSGRGMMGRKCQAIGGTIEQCQ